MTIGIYALYWEEQDLIYIGQSQHIEVRYREHLRLLASNKHTNYKVQNAYILYGPPTLNILEICPIIQCNELEVQWTDEFNSLSSLNGLNIIEAGKVGWGTNSNSSKYSKIQILKVFSYLYTHKGSLVDIQKRTAVDKFTISDILKGTSHRWLQCTYPDKYMLLSTRKRKVRSISSMLGTKITLLSPEGNIFHIENITEFCKELNIPNIALTSIVRGFARVIDGTRKQYKGWTLYNSL